MLLTHALCLAVLQGITEFIPISSSGHLVMAQTFIGRENVPILFDLILHLGTATATAVVYYTTIKDILKDVYFSLFQRKKFQRTEASQANLRLFIFILFSTVVTGVLGMLWRDLLRSFFYTPSAVPFFFVANGMILFLTRYVQSGDRQRGRITFIDSSVIGGVQALAILPGISRSGSTISAGLFMGMSRQVAGMYSFLLSIPSVFGASILEFITTEGHSHETTETYISFLVFLVSFIVGYSALKLLLRFIKKGKLYAFSYYCFAAGIVSFIATRPQLFRFIH